MKETSQPSFGRFIAMLMIGGGLIVIGASFLVMLRNSDANQNQTQGFRSVPLAVNYAAPALNLQTLDGKAVSLADYHGKVVMLNLWATWCPPCKEELPTLESFYEKYKDSGFVLIGINQEETREIVAPFVYNYGLTYPIWMDPDYLAQREFNTNGLPSSYVVDRNGRVRLMWIGGISPENLEKYVPDVINKN